jgi:hypothetical protein
MPLRVLKYDDDQYTDHDTYIEDESLYSQVDFKEKLDPSNSWAAPFVTGHKYRWSIGFTGLNFENIDIQLSERWQ